MTLLLEQSIKLPDDDAESAIDWLTPRNEFIVWEAARIFQIAVQALRKKNKNSFEVVCYSGKMIDEPSIWIDMFARDD